MRIIKSICQFTIYLFVGLTLLIAPATLMAAEEAKVPVSPSDGKNTYYMFVQNAQSGSFTPNSDKKGFYTLVLEGVGDRTIYFSDRPKRDAGTQETAPFLKALGFSAKNPPNAALVVTGKSGSESTAIIELMNPHYDEKASRLTYDARILKQTDGKGLAVFAKRANAKMPTMFNQCSLFIDDCPDAWVECSNSSTGANCGGASVGCCYSFPSCGPCQSNNNGACNSQSPDCCQGNCTSGAFIRSCRL